jgi:hypothetical protein
MAFSSAVVPSSGAEDRWAANKHINMDRAMLLPALKDKPLYSLSEIGARKRKQFQARQGSERVVTQLRESSVLSEQQVQDVYYSLPFFAKPPKCSLLYSTEQDFRSLEELYSKTAKVRHEARGMKLPGPPCPILTILILLSCYPPVPFHPPFATPHHHSTGAPLCCC